MGEIIATRFSRRSFLKGALAVSAISATVAPAALLTAERARAGGGAVSAFNFPEVEAGVDEAHHVAEGYDADILLRWGDPIFADAPEFNPMNQSAEPQARQPSVGEVGATFSTATTANGWFAMPDNCAVDAAGRLWVSTDGNNPKATGRTDGLWAVDTEGEARATSKLFFRVPVGAEMCGPLVTPGDETLFLAVQHPGDGGDDWEPFGRPSYYEDLSTRWPDFKDDMPVRPSLVVVTRQGGGKIAV